MDVSVIMINYNTFELTQNALDSIFEYTSGLEYEIILIDNNSPDGSGEKLSAHFGDRIKYIQAGANLGTSKSFNLGLRAAGGKYVLWLNTDILIKENFIKKLSGALTAAYAAATCSISTAAPLILFAGCFQVFGRSLSQRV